MVLRGGFGNGERCLPYYIIYTRVYAELQGSESAQVTGGEECREMLFLYVGLPMNRSRKRNRWALVFQAKSLILGEKEEIERFKVRKVQYVPSSWHNEKVFFIGEEVGKKDFPFFYRQRMKSVS